MTDEDTRRNGNTLNERMAVAEQRLVSLEEDVRGVEEALKSLRSTILAFAFTVAGSAVAILLGLTQVIGR